MLIYGLIAVGIHFTIRLRFQQVPNFGGMIRTIIGSATSQKGAIHTSCNAWPSKSASRQAN